MATHPIIYMSGFYIKKMCFPQELTRAKNPSFLELYTYTYIYLYSLFGLLYMQNLN